MTAQSRSGEEVRASELVAALCLATDVAMGFPLEHGLQSTVVALRLADRLGADEETRFQTYYGCLLLYAGCTADAEVAATIFPDGALLAHFTPAVFGSPRETVTGIARALSDPERSAVVRAAQVARRMPRAALGHREHIDAMCQVAQMLSRRLGMPEGVVTLFDSFAERWDGRGVPSRAKGDALPLALRIVHVARDATFQRLIHDRDEAAAIIRDRSGGAFDPAVVRPLVNDFEALTTVEPQSAWDRVVASEPGPPLILDASAVDEAMGAIADFADLVSPYLTGHSSGVAALAAKAAELLALDEATVTAVRRAGLLHDIGRVAVPARVWFQEEPLSSDDWERIRLHPYHSERILARSPYLSALAEIAGFHHERLDSTGYHRGCGAAALAPAARLLAVADAFQTKTEQRPHRAALSVDEAATHLEAEVARGRLDRTCVDAVVKAAGLRRRSSAPPGGLTAREAEVVGLLARGLQTKQVARRLGISVKTADRHIQNSYAKIGVSTRAAAAVFAMQHGLVWGELPMEEAPPRS